jgi:hypothetical protein
MAGKCIIISFVRPLVSTRFGMQELRPQKIIRRAPGALEDGLCRLIPLVSMVTKLVSKTSLECVIH